jgi:hypothetical protein
VDRATVTGGAMAAEITHGIAVMRTQVHAANVEIERVATAETAANVEKVVSAAMGAWKAATAATDDGMAVARVSAHAVIATVHAVKAAPTKPLVSSRARGRNKGQTRVPASNRRMRAAATNRDRTKGPGRRCRPAM